MKTCPTCDSEADDDVELCRNCHIILTVLLSLAAKSFLAGQTLVGISGGLNYSKPPDKVYSSDVVSETYGGVSYSFLLEIKGGKPKPFHPGVSFMFYQSSYEWVARNSGHTADRQDINYKIDYLRISIFPEFTSGKRFQFFCNLGPYIGFMVHSSKDGTSWTYKYINYYPREVVEHETGSASDDLQTVDFGIQGSAGINYYILPWLGLTFEENITIGFLNLNETDYVGKIRNFSLSFLIGVSFKIIKDKSSK